MTPTYYGANVRIEYRGTGLDRILIVQAANPLTGGWIDKRRFYESASYCYTDARAYASDLASTMHSESSPLALGVSK
jgi:hypothetical protein